MTVVGSIGIGTFFFLIFVFVLILTYIIGRNTKAGKIVFGVLLSLFILIFAFLCSSPLQGQVKKVRIVENWYILVFFSIAILIGFVFAFCAYFYTVLLHEDNPAKINA